MARADAGLSAAVASGVKPGLSTIHQAKGDQAEAALLLIPGGRMPDRTNPVLSGAASDAEIVEALRVPYVGVTQVQCTRPCCSQSLPQTSCQRSSATTAS
jgi:hypothetical protein